VVLLIVAMAVGSVSIAGGVWLLLRGRV